MLARIRVAPVVAVVVLGAGCSSGGAEEIDRLPGMPEVPEQIPVMPSDAVIVDAASGVFEGAEQRCLSRGPTGTPPAFLLPGDVPYVGCLLQGRYADLANHQGRVLTALIYPPPDNLDVLTETTALSFSDGDVVLWVRSPLGWGDEAFDDVNPGRCGQVWEEVDVPGAVQAVGCTKVYSEKDGHERRVAVTSEDVLVFVDVRVELIVDEPWKLRRPTPEAVDYADALALRTAERLLAQVP